MSDEPVMSVGECIGTPAAVTWNGTEYRLSAPTPEAFDRLERRVAALVFEQARENQAFDPGAVAAARDGLAARWHRVGGRYWDAVFAGPAGQRLMLWGLVAANHPEFTEDQARDLAAAEPDQVEVALLLAAPDFFAAAAARAGAAPSRAAASLAGVRARAAEALAARTP